MMSKANPKNLINDFVVQRNNWYLCIEFSSDDDESDFWRDVPDPQYLSFWCPCL